MEQKPKGRSAGPIRVLLVEDNPGDARLLKEYLAESRTEFEVETVNTLNAAVTRLAEGGIEVVLSDLSLPDSQGIATFTRLHEAAPQVPLLVLSGLDDESLAVETVELGAQDYLVKGHVDSHLLVRAIRYGIKRMEVEKALADQRDLLRNVIDNQPDSIYVKDAEGRYILDNLAHMRSLGAKTPEEVVGKTAFDFFPEKVATQFQRDDEAVMASGEALLNRAEAVIDEEGAKHWLATSKVPLRNRAGEVVGLVGIRRDITERKRAEEQLASSNEKLRAKNAEMEDDLQMASEIQQAFLPQQLPKFPRFASESALRFYSKYLPTGAVGGDFFHILALSDTVAGVFICDVMGHGVRAALVTAIQRALVEELSSLGKNPGEFMAQINRALLSILRRTRTPLFASAFYVCIDVTTGDMGYANAGHPKPLHLRRDAGIVETLSGNDRRPGPALGVFEHSEYATYHTKLVPHDLILLYTDGLFEVEREDGQMFDQQKLAAIIRKRIRQPAESLFDDTLADLQAFTGGRAFEDDVCMVGVEFDGLPEVMIMDKKAPALS